MGMLDSPEKAPAKPSGRRLRVKEKPDEGELLERFRASPDAPGLFYLVQVNSTDETIEDGLPLGVLAVGSALKQAGYRPVVRVIKETGIEELAREVARERPRSWAFR